MSADTRQAGGKRTCRDLLQLVLAVRGTFHRGADSLSRHEENAPDGRRAATARHRTRSHDGLPATFHVVLLSARLD